jgi:hypothetical protein
MNIFVHICSDLSPNISPKAAEFITLLGIIAYIWLLEKTAGVRAQITRRPFRVNESVVSQLLLWSLRNISSLRKSSEMSSPTIINQSQKATTA